MIIHYFSINSKIPTRDQVYLKNLSKTGYQIVHFHDDSAGIKKFIRLAQKYRHNKDNADITWVGYTAYILVPFVKILTGKKVIFNASNSMYDGMIISRKVGSLFSYLSLKYWLIDFFSFIFADQILVETYKQKDFISKKFFIKPYKLIRALTGADDEFFFKDDSIKKNEVFTAVFRGGFLPESGIECALEAAALLKKEDIRFRIIGWGMLEEKVKKIIHEKKLDNVELILGRNFPIEQLREMMLSCHICLGQLSDHPKLSRTIPHKAFESLAMGMPYLTSRTEGILELLEENQTCLCFEPGNSEDLAKKVLWAKNNLVELNQVAQQGYNLYIGEFKSGLLTKDLIEKIA